MLFADGTDDLHGAEQDSEVVLRPLREQDIDAVCQIECESFPDAYGREMFRRELNNRISYYVTARLGGEIAGYAGIWVILGEAEVVSIAVAPRFRRRGIGRALMRALLEECDRAAVFALRLEVRRSNLAAQKLYDSMGFRPYGVREKYYDGREDAILMIREGGADDAHFGDRKLL